MSDPVQKPLDDLDGIAESEMGDGMMLTGGGQATVDIEAEGDVWELAPVCDELFGIAAWATETLVCEAVSPAIHLSCRLMSPAECHRSSGSFAKQVSTTASSAGGVTACVVESVGARLCMIAAIRLAWLSPEKACFPVTIS